MAFDIGAIFKIKAGVEGQQQLDRLNQSLKQTETQGGKLGSVLGGLRGTFAAAFSVTAVYQFGKAVVTAASEAEQASNRLRAVLRATGNSAGFAKFELDEMADSMAASTQFDDESIRNAQAQFLKFGNIQGDVFERGLRLSADLAAFMGGDVASAAQLVGKALASPSDAIGTLERQIGKLTPAQEKMIKDMVETGRLAEAQAAVLTILQQKIGGTAEQMNSGLLGATTGVKKAWDEMLESFGKTALVRVPVDSFLTFLKDSLNDIKRIVEDESWVQKLKGIGLWALGFRNFDMSPKAPETDEQRRERTEARDAGADAAWQRGIADQNARIEKAAEEARKKAADNAKKLQAENERLLQAGIRGWVEYADEVFRLADEENLALAKIAADEKKHFDEMRKEFVDMIDPLERYRQQLVRIAEAERIGALTAEEAREARALTQKQMEKVIDDEARAFGKLADDGKDAFKELKEAVEGWGRQASQAFTDWAFGAKGNIRDVVTTMLREFAQMMVYKNVFAPLANAGSNWLTSFIPKFFHSGGVVGAGGSYGRAVSPLAFAGAPRMHSGGMAGLRSDEVPAILQTGERVLPRGASGGDVNVAVTVNMQQGGGAQATSNTSGGMELGRVLGDTVRGIIIDEQRPGGLLAGV